MPVQDDAREREMRQLFNLTIAEDRKRADIDARLAIDGRVIPFELKSTTDTSVSTVRDFGPDHIAKWRNGLHWIFAFYNERGDRLKHCIYASPADMEPWIARMEAYIRPDVLLADRLPARLTPDDVTSVLGEKETYSLDDAKAVMKQQWKAAQYVEFQDLKDGYSRARMTELFQLRARYVILRGSTLNNPHIPGSFFEPFEQIRSEHAARLRELVRAYLSKAEDTESAIA